MSLPFGLQDRPLLDVQLEEGRQRMLAAALGAAIADPVQRRAEGRAVAVLPRRAQSRSNTLANTPEATIAGAKREPSSLVQFTTSIGA